MMRTAPRKGITVVRADIYQSIPFWHTPRLAFLLIENVLNDPGYPEIGKNIEQLAKNITSVMHPNGLVIIADGIRNQQQKLHPFYRQLSEQLQHTFVRILDDGLSGDFFHPPFDDILWVEKRATMIMDLLSPLMTPDQSLSEGLQRAAQDGTTKWMVFQNPHHKILS